MKLSKLLAYTFDRNVGIRDRIFRMLSGLALAATPWIRMHRKTLRLSSPLRVLPGLW